MRSKRTRPSKNLGSNLLEHVLLGSLFIPTLLISTMDILGYVGHELYKTSTGYSGYKRVCDCVCALRTPVPWYFIQGIISCPGYGLNKILNS